MNIVIILFSVFIFVSCHKKTKTSYEEWEKNTKSTSPPISLKELNTEKKYFLSVDKRQITIARQLHEGLPVHSTFVKKIEISNSPIKIQAHTIKLQRQNQVAVDIEIKTNKHYADIIVKNSGALTNFEIVSKEIVWLADHENPQKAILVNFFDKYTGGHQALISADHKLLKLSRAGANFHQVHSSLYRIGPKLEDLIDVSLTDVSEIPNLSSRYAVVSSESDKKITTLSQEMIFPTDDDRFDQLQTFFYLNQVSNWVEKHFQIQLNEKIEAVVALGYPEKLNSAFYFQNKIRLGKGDDKTYSRMTHDASIVYHEFMHAIIDRVSGLGHEGEAGSLNEAFADFFACHILKRPFLGESSYLLAPYKRSLVQSLKFDSQNGGLYHDSLIISSLLWEIREKIGPEKTEKLVFEILLQMHPYSDFNYFKKTIHTKAELYLNETELLIFREILKSRGALE